MYVLCFLHDNKFEVIYSKIIRHISKQSDL